MSPSECVLERRVRTDANMDLAATNLPLFILNCKDRKAEGYAAAKLEIYNQRLQDMVIGVRLADAPPAVSYLAILGSVSFADIVAVDKTVIVIRLDIPGSGLSYLIYDAVALSLRMIPAPVDPKWGYALSSSVSVARPCGGPDYALVITGRLFEGGEDSLFLWRPSSSSPPWSKKMKCSFPGLIGWSVNKSNMEFPFNGHAYWVDLLCGIFYCSCDTLFDDNSSVVNFGSFIHLPVEPVRHDSRIAKPASFRTIGVVRDSFIRFVSIDGFQNYLELKDRTVTVWKLLGHNQQWEEEHKLSLEKLWGFEGFGDLPKDLTPMYPLLSMEDADIVYLVLGECGGNPLKRKFFPSYPRYLLAVDMTNKIVRTSVPLEDEDDWLHDLVSCRFSLHLQKALDGPCDDEGIPMKKKCPIPMKKPTVKKLRSGERIVAESPIPMKKPWMKKPTVKKLRSGERIVEESPIPMKKRKFDGGNVAEAPMPMKKKPMCC